MQALFKTVKGRKVEGGWEHPRTGTMIGYTDQEVFCIDAEDNDTGEQIIGFVVDRYTLERIAEEIDRALTIEPVRIQLANS